MLLGIIQRKGEKALRACYCSSAKGKGERTPLTYTYGKKDSFRVDLIKPKYFDLIHQHNFWNVLGRSSIQIHFYG